MLYNHAICKRVLSFISKCVNSDCDSVKLVVRHTIVYGGMTSPLGRSALFSGLRYKFETVCLLGSTFNCCNLVWNSYLSNVSAELSANVFVLRNLLLFRDNQYIRYHPFETDEIAIAINFMYRMMC